MRWKIPVLLLLLLSACNMPNNPPAGIDPGGPGLPSPTTGLIPAGVIAPADLHYLGAFRLPEGRERPYTFEYGGNAMTFNPQGDPNGPADGFSGSLFISGHDRLPYNELPNGTQIAEVEIPVPVNSREISSLNRTGFLHDFQDVTQGQFTAVEEIVRLGLLYLDSPQTGPLIHLAWGQHIEPDPTAPTHAWFAPDLSPASFQGPWFISAQPWYSLNDYMFEIPLDWASLYTNGWQVATGRFKDGGWSGMGPVIIAYQPWDEQGLPYPPGASIPSITLLRYASSTESEDIQRALANYQHPDEWSGAAWLQSPSSGSAVIFAGAKAIGPKYWYGYINPAGPQFPCVDEDVTDFITCRLQDGTSCSPEDFSECPGHSDYRGWWSPEWSSRFIFYDPADLARVARGELQPWEPQPYATLEIDDHLYNNPSAVEVDLLGTGAQRRYRIGDVAYDRQNNLLYVLELFADGAAPVIHVWQIR